MSATTAKSEDYFCVVELAPNIYMCREKHYHQKLNSAANLYIIQGASMDLIIDTGLGVWDFKAFLLDKQLISLEKPYQAVVTHVHFDHAGGLYQFAESCVIHENEQEAIETGDNVAECTFVLQSDCDENPPTPDWNAANYKVQPVQPTRILKGKRNTFDLGNGQILEAIHTPGHSAGSIVLWDEHNGILFSGDTVYEGSVLDWAPTSNVEDYIVTMGILSDLAPSVKRVLPGHGHEFNGARLQELADGYLNDAGTCHLCTTNLTQRVVTLILRGRNVEHAAAARCCYHACCCRLLFGPPMKHK